MTWYYMPYTCAPDTEGSSSLSEESRAPWLTLSGTPTRRPLSWRGWKRRAWDRADKGVNKAQPWRP